MPIARRYGVSVSELKRWNKKRKYPVRGQLLTVYQKKKVEIDKKEEQEKGPFTEETTVSNDATNQMEAQESSPVPKKDKIANETSKKPVVKKSKSVTHKVRKGETVSAISRKYNVEINDIISLNKLNKKRPIIRVGQVLKIK